MTDKTVSIIGLGKLGACLGAVLANSGFQVIGSDINKDIVDKINQSEPPFTEPKLGEYLKNTDRFKATTETSRAVIDTDVTFIVVNTPSTSSGRYSLKYVENVIRDIGEGIKNKEDPHSVVLTSTVFPGSTSGDVRHWLEKYSGERVGNNLRLCYSPEFIAIGDVINGLENPDFFLIGEENIRAGDELNSIYQEINSDIPVVRMDLISAEITKMAVNSYVTMKISYANTISQICDEIGGDVNVITNALGHDSRISENYLGGGARFGGPCFPRDNAAFSQLARDAGTRAPLAEATDRVNDRQTESIAEIIREKTPRDGSVSILGLTYKPGTYLVEESQGMDLIKELKEEFDLHCYDPMGMSDAQEKLKENIVAYESTIADAVRAGDTAILTTPWEEFFNPEIYDEEDICLIDPWTIFKESELPTSVNYYPFGRLSTSYTH